MRIFLAIIGIKTPRGGDGLWAHNLRDPLRRMGHTVIVSSQDWDSAMEHLDEPQWVGAQRPVASETLLREVKREHATQPLDLFLSYFYDVHVEPSAIQAISEMGIPTVNFYCNAVHQFHLVAEIAPSYTLCWVPEIDALHNYARVGARFIHLPMAADPSAYKPVVGISRDIPLLFVGSLYADRAQWLAELCRHELPLRLHSRLADKSPPSVARVPTGMAKRNRIQQIASDLAQHGPAFVTRRITRKLANDRSGHVLRSVVAPPPLEHDDMLVLFARSHAILNLSHVYEGGVPGGRIRSHVRLRDFEVPMARGLLLAQHSDELSFYFDTDREVLTWSSVTECGEKLRFYLAHTDIAEKIRQAGQIRALRDHTWEHRYRRLFGELGLSTQSSR